MLTIMTNVLSVLCALLVLPIVLAAPGITNESAAAIDNDAKPVSTMNLATLLDAAFQKNHINLSNDVVDEADLTTLQTTIISSTTEPITEESTKPIATSELTTAATTTTTGKPSEELIPPALVNATIAQMHNKQHRTGQIVIT